MLLQDSTADELKLEIHQAMVKGCDCTSACFTKLTVSNIYSHVLQMHELQKVEKDMYLMGLLDATHNSAPRDQPATKRRKHYEYNCLGVPVCHKAFLLCHDVKKQLANIVKHMAENGIKPRTHGKH